MVWHVEACWCWFSGRSSSLYIVYCTKCALPNCKLSRFHDVRRKVAGFCSALTGSPASSLFYLRVLVTPSTKSCMHVRVVVCVVWVFYDLS